MNRSTCAFAVVLVFSMSSCERLVKHVSPAYPQKYSPRWHADMLLASQWETRCLTCGELRHWRGKCESSSEGGPGKKLGAKQTHGSPLSEEEQEEQFRQLIGKMRKMYSNFAPGAPFHLNELIRIGPRSSTVLIELLPNDMPTPYKYREQVTFAVKEVFVGVVPETRTATLGDLADYALRAIHKTKVGWRSYHSEKERKEAIERWRDIAK